MGTVFRGLMLLGVTLAPLCALRASGDDAGTTHGATREYAAETPSEGAGSLELPAPTANHEQRQEPESVLTPMPLEDGGPQDSDDVDFDHPAPTCSSGTWLNRGSWYSQADFIYMSPNVRHGTLLARDLVTPPTGVTLRTDKSLGFAPGIRLTLGRYLCRDDLNRDTAVEFTFFGLNKWTEQQGVHGTFLSTVLDPTNGVVAPGFFLSPFQQFTYQSELNSYEVNLRLNRRLGRDRMELQRDGTWVRTCQPSTLPSFFAGFRLVTLNERFDYLAQNDTRTATTGDFLVQTHNDLVGLQFGSDWYYQACNWRVGVRGKAGPYFNFADQSTSVTQTPEPTGVPRNETATGESLAFVGEVNLMGAYQIRPNMALRAGYELMWLNDVALGPNQVRFVVNDPPVVHLGGAPFYTAFAIGFEMVW